MKQQIRKSELARVRAPRGYSFEVNKPTTGISYAYVKLYKKGVPGFIGRVTLEPDGSKRFVTHSRLDDAYHNQGLGALMYAKAIQWCLDNGYKVRSSYSPSSYAQRVWAGSSLRRYFSIRDNSKNVYSKSWTVLRQKKKPRSRKKAK